VVIAIFIKANGGGRRFSAVFYSSGAGDLHVQTWMVTIRLNLNKLERGWMP